MSEGKGPRAGVRRQRRRGIGSSLSAPVLALIALLAACARTQLELDSPPETQGEGSAKAGAAAQSAGGSPSAGGASQLAASGRPATVGGAGGAGNGGNGAGGDGSFAGMTFGEFGGMGGEPAAEAGAGGDPLTVPRCAPGLTPNLAGPPLLEFDASPLVGVSGDWNRDGRLDLATANYEGTVSVALGNGDGTFSILASYATNLVSINHVSPRLAAGDLNHDGALDLVVAHSSAAVSVLLGHVDGTFTPGVSYAVVGEISSLALGDFDADGAADIVVSRMNSGWNDDLEVLRGNGDGSFGRNVTSLALDGQAAIAAGDLNGDGRLDVVAFTTSKLTIALGNGDGTFSASDHEFPGYLYSRSVVIADFDADGRADLAIARGCGMEPFAHGAVELMHGNGDGTFSSTTYELASCPDHLEVVDANSDGRPDLMTSATSVLLGSGDGGFTSELQSPRSYDYFLSTGDWNGDGKLDVATSYEHWFAVHLGNGDGSFGSVPQLVTGPEPRGLVVADLDADGILDLVTPNYDSRHPGSTQSTVSVLRGLGDGTFAPHVEYPTGASPYDLRAADLNRDGRLDLISLNSNKSVGVLLGAGKGAMAPSKEYAIGDYIDGFQLGDLDGDGRSDLVSRSGTLKKLNLLFGSGNGGFAASAEVSLAFGPMGMALFDANGDGALDLALSDFWAEKLQLILGNGDGTFSGARSWPTVHAPGAIASGDLNEDGKPDLIDLGAIHMSVHLGDGSGSFANRVEYAIRGDHLEVADFDRDGHQDLLVTGLGIQLLLGTGDGTFKCWEQYAPGLPTIAAGSGDFNRDGRLDIAVTTYDGTAVLLNSRR